MTTGDVSTRAHARGRVLSARKRADLALLLVAGVWGATFVMVKDALADIGPLTFVAYRFGLASLALLPFLWMTADRRRPAGAGKSPPADDQARGDGPPLPAGGGRLAFAGGIVGGCLFAGYALQTAGLQYTQAGRAGFITGLSVVIVPIVHALAARRPMPRGVAGGVTLAVVGLGLLSLGDLASGPVAIGLGDLLVFGCAWGFALHILAVGRFAPNHGVLGLTFAQIATVALLSGVAALVWERPTWASLAAAWPAAAFTGLLATVVAFAVQTRAQRLTTTTHTALIFSTEPVFAALFAYLLAGERLGPAELLGCGLILGGMLLAQPIPNPRAPSGAAQS